MRKKWIAFGFTILALTSLSAYAVNHRGGNTANTVSQPIERGNGRYLVPMFRTSAHRNLIYADTPATGQIPSKLSLDLYEPESDNLQKRPVVVFIHGGGYKSGDKQEATEICTELAKRGFVAISPNYRLRDNPDLDFFGTLNDAMDDVSNVLQWIESHQDEYRLDASRIAIGGDSAGGHLSVNFSNERSDKRNANSIFAILNFYGGGIISPDWKTKYYPPVIFLHGRLDQTVPYERSVGLSEQLLNHHVYHDFLTFDDAGHRFYKSKKYWDLELAAITHFMRNTMNADKQAFLPETTGIQAFAGDIAKIRLKRQPAFANAQGHIRLKLPEGWKQGDDGAFQVNADATVSIQVPNAAAGYYPVVAELANDPQAADAASFSFYVEVVPPLKLTVSTFYDASSEQVGTRLEALNVSAATMMGKLVIRQEASGKPREETFDLESLNPGKTKTVVLPQAIDGAYSVRVTDPDGNVLQKYEATSHVLVSAKSTKSFRIDGSLADWSDQTVFPLDKKDEIRIPDWKGPDDISGKGYVAWDDRYFRIALEMTDDQHVPDKRDSEIWQGDSVQFALALPESSGIPGVHEFGVSLQTDGSVKTWRWIAPEGFQTGPVKSMEVAAVRKGNQTMYEIAVPWEEILKQPDRLQEGDVIKFSLMVNDNDGDGRRGWIEYNSGISDDKNIQLFGDLCLVGG
ncbi:alpha/beta hydrolase fold domain-containing protein [Paenibacillus sp. SI8]|uniref:alpha/beta hydrolase fold domain-containing protein n=1 Tax=unclassified Paenibacillus TaxID=185978 RepID=UPI003466C023